MSDVQLVAGDELVSQDADQRRGDTPADVSGRPVLQQLAKALHAGEGGARPNDNRDPDAGQVLGPLQAVWVPFTRSASGHPEADEYDETGGDIGQVVQRVSEEPDGAGDNRNEQLQRAGERKT